LIANDNDLIHQKLKEISEIRSAITDSLKKEYDEELAKIYTHFSLE